LQPTRLEGVSGTAISELNPDGTVRVRGESWSAHSLNGRVPAGGTVQVINAKGVRLEVWGEEALSDERPNRTIEPEGLDAQRPNGQTQAN
jgi:membrane-bound ClpP family serine protease